ncbi:MAG TPA: FtsK/SpoIIIE domain-containing protein, partial [Oligoflexia bacterium]|nr:FtsK/SpoIIIE domain-containing protein [Oligoflexia bacterium]
MASRKTQNKALSALFIIIGLFYFGNLCSGAYTPQRSAAIFLALLAVSGLALIVSRSSIRTGEVEKEEFIRGRLLQPFHKISERAAALSRSTPKQIFWGGLYLPDTLSTSHFLVCGATGSGKTITLRLLMQSVLP